MSHIDPTDDANSQPEQGLSQKPYPKSVILQNKISGEIDFAQLSSYKPSQTIKPTPVEPRPMSPFIYLHMPVEVFIVVIAAFIAVLFLAVAILVTLYSTGDICVAALQNCTSTSIIYPTVPPPHPTNTYTPTATETNTPIHTATHTETATSTDVPTDTPTETATSSLTATRLPPPATSPVLRVTDDGRDTSPDEGRPSPAPSLPTGMCFGETTNSNVLAINWRGEEIRLQGRTQLVIEKEFNEQQPPVDCQQQDVYVVARLEDYLANDRIDENEKLIICRGNFRINDNCVVGEN